MSVKRLPLVVSALVLLLSACGDDAAPETAQAGSASGEVLPGSISDDMIATDALRSQGPQVVEAPTSAASGAPGAAATTEGEEAPVEAEAAPEPEAAAE